MRRSAENVGLSPEQCEPFLETLKQLIAEAMISGGEIELRKFGTLRRNHSGGIDFLPHASLFSEPVGDLKHDE